MTSPEPQLPTCPDTLAPAVAQARERLAQAQPSVLEALEQAAGKAAVDRVLCGSEFAANVAARLPQSVIDLIAQNRLGAEGGVVVADFAGAFWAAEPVERRLRWLRDRELFAIVWRDLTDAVPVASTLAHLSTLADALIQLACDQAVVENPPPDDAWGPPLVLAMGKLGGGELNFSSDVDLIFLHPANDPHAAPYYAALARRVIALLDARSEDGFVYRVDTRLRPFGASAALSLSFDAFEAYLQNHSRDWERYAYVKARAICGRPADRQLVHDVLRAYVYRRYLDFGVFESLRETKGQIETDVARRKQHGDIKRGAGGIREVEFVVQALQLIRGGRQRQLQTQSLYKALSMLTQLGWLEEAAATGLRDAYDFLRRTENRLQMWRDAQTHDLPGDTVGRARLAYSMGFANWPDYFQALTTQQKFVAAAFNELLGPRTEAEVSSTPARQLWSASTDPDEVRKLFAQAGVDDVDGVVQTLEQLRNGRIVRRLGKTGRKRLDQLMPRIIELAALRPDGATVFARVAQIIERVGRRSAYFSLLNENPLALERLVNLCRGSASIARQVADNPLLLDSLIDPRLLDLPTHEERSAQLHASLHGGVREDLELLIDALSQFKSTAVFEVSVADLASELPVMKVSDHLTWIAQSVLTEVLVSARQSVAEKFGEPTPADGAATFGVIAYGKMGGLELGYGSDLDIVFLYDCGAADPPTSGPRVVASSMYFARLVQRFAHIAGATTRFGSLYEIDMRLRPSGNSGPLVSSLAAFARYQRQDAWTWEHQALLRARPVAGDRQLAQRFGDLRQEILCMPRDPASLAADVVKMRQRMRHALHKPRAGLFHLKHGPGGLTDVEFLIQYWLLAHAAAEPDLIHFSDHMRQLDALIDSQVVPADQGREVQEIYLTYRTWLHRQALRGDRPRIEATQLMPERAQIVALWQDTFGKWDAPD